MSENIGVDETVGTGLVGLAQIVFQLTFPLMFTTLCLVSFVLMVVFHLPQMSLWFLLGYASVQFSLSHWWAALGIAAFVLLGVWFTWVAFKEHPVSMSRTIGKWVSAAICIGLTVWAGVAWPYNGSSFQLWVCGFLLLGAWAGIFDGLISLGRLVTYHRSNRPIPPPIHQQPHGRSNEPETI